MSDQRWGYDWATASPAAAEWMNDEIRRRREAGTLADDEAVRPDEVIWQEVIRLRGVLAEIDELARDADWSRTNTAILNILQDETLRTD